MDRSYQQTYYSSCNIPSSSRTQEQLEFESQVAGLRRGGHMRQNDILPPPVRKVRRGWMRMPNAIVGKADDVERMYTETPTPIQTAFNSYAAKSRKGRTTDTSPPTLTSTSTPEHTSTPALTSTRKRASRISNTSAESSDCSPIFDDECPDTPSTSATSLSSLADSDSSSSSSSDTETYTSPKDAMRTMKAVQDSLEILELYGPDKLAYHFIDRSLSNVKEAELVATVAPIVVAEADAMNIPNTEVIFPKLGALAVDRFRQYWSENGLWKQDLADVAHLNPQADYVELKPTNIGVLIGALFRQGIIPAHTIHECLDALVEGRVSFPHLSVMRAIVKHAGSKLCLPDDENNFKSVMFMRKLGRESPHTGLYVWGWNRDAAWLRSDIVLTLENWAMAEKERMERQKGKERKKPEVVSGGLEKAEIKSENLKQLSRLGKRVF